MSRKNSDIEYLRGTGINFTPSKFGIVLRPKRQLHRGDERRRLGGPGRLQINDPMVFMSIEHIVDYGFGAIGHLHDPLVACLQYIACAIDTQYIICYILNSRF